MIIGDLKDSSRIDGIHAAFKKVFDYVKSNDLLNAELGRIELDGDDLYINNVEVKGVTREEQVLEGHRDYIDMHILLDGREEIGWLDINEATQCTQEYDKEKECVLYSDTPSFYAVLKPQQYAIVYPEDLHAPIISNGKIRKLIVKVKL